MRLVVIILGAGSRKWVLESLMLQEAEFYFTPCFHSGASSCSFLCQVSLRLKFYGSHFTENNLVSCGWGRKGKSSSCIDCVCGGWFLLLHKKSPPASPLNFNPIPLPWELELPSPELLRLWRTRSTSWLLSMTPSARS